MSGNWTIIESIEYKKKFKSDYKKLKPDIKKEVNKVLDDILKKPIPSHLRFNKLNGYKNPNIYAIHVTANHSHKITLEIEGTAAVLRRIGTHRVIDRAP